jgi:radical SAM protein with 4Fe4S-binding SPASM domain
MCNQAYGKIEDMKMEPEIYHKIVHQFYPFVRTVQLTAIGEPMMTPHIKDKIADMIRYGARLEMVTNGTLMKGDPLLEQLASVSELITVSLDGATPETFNSIRNGADFNDIIKNLERFNHFRNQIPATERTHLNFNYILMKRNIHELPDFVDLAADLGAETIICSHLVLYEESLEKEMLIHSPQLSNRYTAEAADRAELRGISIVLPPPFQVNPAVPERTTGNETKPLDGGEPSSMDPPDETNAPYEGEKCYFLWKRVYIGPHGEVVPCCLSGIESFGSLKHNSFTEIWNSPRYQTMRKLVHTTKPPAPCKGCYLINRNPHSAEFKKI